MRTAYLAIILALAFSSVSGAKQEGGKDRDKFSKEPFKVFDTKSEAPVEITSQRLSASLSQNKIIFIGQVVMRHGERTIYADKMEASYGEDGEIENLHATGNVKMTGEDSFAAGEKLYWDNKKNTVRLWDNPRLIQGRQMILGQEMVFYIKEDRLNIDMPRIEWLPPSEETGKQTQPRETGADEPGK
jgi:lipopolysaccharide transport protein LptA